MRTKRIQDIKVIQMTNIEGRIITALEEKEKEMNLLGYTEVSIAKEKAAKEKAAKEKAAKEKTAKEKKKKTDK